MKVRLAVSLNYNAMICVLIEVYKYRERVSLFVISIVSHGSRGRTDRSPSVTHFRYKMAIKLEIKKYLFTIKSSMIGSGAIRQLRRRAAS